MQQRRKRWVVFWAGIVVLNCVLAGVAVTQQPWYALVYAFNAAWAFLPMSLPL